MSLIEQTKKLIKELKRLIKVKYDFNRQSAWEVALEDALCDATPVQVLEILGKIEGWTLGYCVSCGEYNNTNGSSRGCRCEYKGWWNDNACHSLFFDKVRKIKDN